MSIGMGLLAFWRLNAGGQVARVALALPVGRRDPFERQSRRGCLVADGYGHHQHPIAIGDVGAHGIDWDGERELTVIDTDAPLIDQQLLDLLQLSTLVSMENKPTITRALPHTPPLFPPTHRTAVLQHSSL